MAMVQVPNERATVAIWVFLAVNCDRILDELPQAESDAARESNLEKLQERVDKQRIEPGTHHGDPMLLQEFEEKLLPLLKQAIKNLEIK